MFDPPFDRQRTRKAMDLLHKLQEEPLKAHLLPPNNISKEDLHKWYEEMSKPVRTIPFPTPSKEYLRRDRIKRAIQSGQRPDPEDLAEESAEQIPYQQKLADAFEKSQGYPLAGNANTSQQEINT